MCLVIAVSRQVKMKSNHRPLQGFDVSNDDLGGHRYRTETLKFEMSKWDFYIRFLKKHYSYNEEVACHLFLMLILVICVYDQKCT